jgi:uncharacterized membrane protein YeaQ/YmgE (transglycosylase-associated protein family)
MSAETLLIILLVGLIAGWLTGQIVRGTGFGLIADIAIGIVGALIGSWLLPHLGIHLGPGIVPAIIERKSGVFEIWEVGGTPMQREPILLQNLSYPPGPQMGPILQAANRDLSNIG